MDRATFSRLLEREKTLLIILAGAVLITAFFIFGFFEILEEIINGQGVLQLDLNILRFIDQIRSSRLNEVMLYITLLGKSYTITLGVIFLSIIFIVSKKWNYFLTLLITVISGQLFVTITKNIIGRTRPPFISSLVREGTFSFPSGHTFVAVTFYGLLTYMVYSLLEKAWQKALTVVFGLIIIFAIGFSRIYLGAHWTTDVLASFAAGSLWLTTAIISLEISKRLKIKDKQRELVRSHWFKWTLLAYFVIWVGYVTYLYIVKSY